MIMRESDKLADLYQQCVNLERKKDKLNGRMTPPDLKLKEEIEWLEEEIKRLEEIV